MFSLINHVMANIRRIVLLNMDIRKSITDEIKRFVAAENAKCSMGSIWQEPIVGFADAKGEYIEKLKDVVHPQHQMPEEVIPAAKTVICYFVPFEKWVAKTNRSGNSTSMKDGNGGLEKALASPEWAESYELTNAMMARLNEHIADFIHKLGYEAKTAPEAAVFYRDEVISHWSFRHLAYAAGLGTFGLNNMLITDKGCSGRYNCLVTNIDVETDEPKKEESCLYKKDGTCGACMVKCPAGAISPDGFNRYKCYEQCLKNAAIYTEFGSSYESDDEKYGSEVCGKCIAGMPCAYREVR